MCDASLENDCIMKREYYSCIYRISFLSFLSSIYAIYCDCYDLAVVPGGVFLTSVNYWRRPTYGWRRNLDMGYVASALIYQNYHAYHSYYYMMNLDQSIALLYLALMLFGIGCYPTSIYLHKKRTYGDQLMSIAVLYHGRGGGAGDGGDGCCSIGIRDRNPPSRSTTPFCPCSDASFFR